MTSSTYSARMTGLSFGAVGLLLGLPLAGIIVFVMLLPSDHVIGNVVASILLGLVPAILSAACAILFVRISPSKAPGLMQGVVSSLLAYVLFFVLLGIWGKDTIGMVATGLHLLLITPILWLYPVIGGVTGIILKRKASAD
jgi:hypothetical protein